MQGGKLERINAVDHECSGLSFPNLVSCQIFMLCPTFSGVPYIKILDSLKNISGFIKKMCLVALKCIVLIKCTIIIRSSAQAVLFQKSLENFKTHFAMHTHLLWSQRSF